MSKLDTIYAHLPVWAQHCAVSAYGLYWRRLRFGPGYQRHLNGYLQRQILDPAAWRSAVDQRLRALLSAAAEQVPYYRDTWSSENKRAAHAGRLADLPLLGKEAPRADARRFLRRDLEPSRELVFHTSGSTGTPIATLWTVDELRNSLALREARSAGWAGVSFNLPRASLSGRIVVPDPHSQGPFHRYNRVERQVYFSAFHLSPDTVGRYLEALAQHRIRWLTGYAVGVYLMARFALDRGLEIPPLDAIVTTSEKLTPGMRKVLQQAFGGGVFEEYSTVENAVFASECEHRRLHVSEDAGILEILRPDGTSCAPGEPGEVVTTCLMRPYQPLVRFRLGDVATWADPADPCPCGRPLPVLQEVVGRVEDVVVGPDGRQMVRFHGVFVDLPQVHEGQVIQEALDRIRVKVVPAAGWDAVDHQTISERIQQRLGKGVEVEVEVVKEIPRTKAGKFQAVISKLGTAPSAAADGGLAGGDQE